MRNKRRRLTFRADFVSNLSDVPINISEDYQKRIGPESWEIGRSRVIFKKIFDRPRDFSHFVEEIRINEQQRRAEILVKPGVAGSQIKIQMSDTTHLQNQQQH